eukprot:202951_1
MKKPLYHLIFTLWILVHIINAWEKGPYGGGGGESFMLNNMNNYIKKICVRYDSLIEAIQVDGGVSSFGGAVPHCYEVNPGQCFTDVFVRYGTYVDSLIFYTSDGLSSPLWGADNNADSDRITPPSHTCLTALGGRHGNVVDQITFYYKPTPNPTAYPTARPSRNPTQTPIECPDGTEQVGELNVDISGCGITQCDDRYDTTTIEECRGQCLSNPYCRSFTFAPIGGDPNFLHGVVCTLYNEDESNNHYGINQKMCKLLGNEYEHQLCFTTNTVNIGDDLKHGILSNTALSSNIFFFDVHSVDSNLLTDELDYISIKLHSFSDITYASYLEIAIYLNKVIIFRVNPSDNSKYQLYNATHSTITSLNEYHFWLEFNPESDTAFGFIRFGIGPSNAYSNELLHFPFINFVENGDTADLRTSYEAFKYIVVSYIPYDDDIDDGSVLFVLYETCTSEDELSAFLPSFGFLSTEVGTSGKVAINVYVKNNIYSCIINTVQENKENVCTNLNFIKYERCSHDSFRQLTHLYDYVMEFTYYEMDYFLLSILYLDNYIITPENTVFLSNINGNNKVLIAFKDPDDDEIYKINGDIIPYDSVISINATSNYNDISLTFGISIKTQKSTQIVIEVYDEYNRYICDFIPSLMDPTLLLYLCVYNSDDYEPDAIYNYISYSKTDCISEETEQNTMKIIIDSDGDIEIDRIFINDQTPYLFCGDTDSALCSNQPSSSDTSCDHLMECVDIGIASDSRPEIKPIIIFDDIFHSTNTANIASYSSLFKLSITTCNAPDSGTKLSLLLKGVLGSSQREILTDLPSNDINLYYIGSTPIGTFFSLQLEIDGNDSICLSEVILTDFITNEILFATDTSTIGKGIYLQRVCGDVGFKLLENNIFIPCYEQLFLLEAYNNRLYTRLTMELCAGETNEVGLDISSQSALSVVITGLDVNGLYLTTDPILLSSDYDWPHTTSITESIREYNIIYDDYDVQSISVIFINNDQLDPICIGKVIINNQRAILTSLWIGAANCVDRPCSPAIPAVLSWPICKTEIIKQTTSLVDSEVEDGEILTSICSNGNRFSSIQCAASKSYAYSISSSFQTAVSNSESDGIEIAQGFETEGHWEIGASVTIGSQVEADLLIGKVTSTATATATVSGGGSISSSNARTTSRATTFERSESFTSDKSSETAISCEASMEVGPFQRVKYDIIKSSGISTYQSFTDFKLTKCSYILDADDNNPDNFVYLMGIPGDITIKETLSCTIKFYETQFYALVNTLTCREAQKIKGIEFDTYVPFCNPGNTAQWDSCQCETGDSKTDPTCYCVDPSTGYINDNIKAAAIDTSITSWKNWCYQNCDRKFTQFRPDLPLVDINGNKISLTTTTKAPISNTSKSQKTTQEIVNEEIVNEDDDDDDKTANVMINDDESNVVSNKEVIVIEDEIKYILYAFLLALWLFLVFCILFVVNYIKSMKDKKNFNYRPIAQHDTESDINV